MAKPAKNKKKFDPKLKKCVLLTGDLIDECFSREITPQSLFDGLKIRRLNLWTSRCVLRKIQRCFGSDVVQYAKKTCNIFPCRRRHGRRSTFRCFHRILKAHDWFDVAALSASNPWRKFKKDPRFPQQVSVFLWNGDTMEMK